MAQAIDRPVDTPAINDIAELLRGWELSLRARNRSPLTIKNYVDALVHLREFLVSVAMLTEVDKYGESRAHLCLIQNQAVETTFVGHIRE